MSESNQAIEAKKESIKTIQSTITDRVNGLMKNGIVAKVWFTYDTVAIDLQEKDFNWTNFLNIRFEQDFDKIKHSFSHGSGAWNEEVTSDQALEATILMFNLCEAIFDVLMDDYSLMKKMWRDYYELSTLQFKKRDEEYAKVFDESYIILEAENKKIVFDEIMALLKDNIKVHLVYVSRQGEICNVFIENRGYDGKLNIYIGTERSSKAFLKNYLKTYIECNGQMFLANTVDKVLA